MVACMKGEHDAVAELLECGADVNLFTTVSKLCLSARFDLRYHRQTFVFMFNRSHRQETLR